MAASSSRFSHVSDIWKGRWWKDEVKEMDYFVFTSLTYLVIRLFISPPCQNLTMYLKFEKYTLCNKPPWFIGRICIVIHQTGHLIIYLADHKDEIINPAKRLMQLVWGWWLCTGTKPQFFHSSGAQETSCPETQGPGSTDPPACTSPLRPCPNRAALKGSAVLPATSCKPQKLILTRDAKASF